LIDAATRALVVARAGNRCEYCALPQAGYAASFNIDHIVALQHRRDNDSENLAWTCPKCNRKKGPNLSGLDPSTGTIALLFHPRKDRWSDHFRWSGALMLGLTGNGRATIALLDLNHEERLHLRQALMAEGTFFPERGV
jgi:hypothetical protein